MFLPDNLSPLPVASRDDAPAPDGGEFPDEFVRAGDVRRVLLGPACAPEWDGLPAEDFASFAGRPAFPEPVVRSRTPGFEISPESLELHPAFQVLPPLKRAAPPKLREEECEAAFGRARSSDRWWVIGMGAVAAVILLSGAAVDFIYREAVRRNRSDVEQVSGHVAPLPPSESVAESKRPDAIAATARPEEE